MGVTCDRVDEEGAIAILGEDNVVLPRMCGVSADAVVDIPFTADALRRCQQDNLGGLSDWRLVCVRGYSLLEMVKVFRVSTTGRDCFEGSEGYDWWFRKSWATRLGEPGYHLIDFTLRFGGMCLDSRCKRISEMSGVHVPDTAELSEAMLRAARCSNPRQLPHDREHGEFHVGSFTVPFGPSSAFRRVWSGLNINARYVVTEEVGMGVFTNVGVYLAKDRNC